MKQIVMVNHTMVLGQPLVLGESGNGCHVECSNRGTCNYALGFCECFEGFTGAACEIIDTLASKGGSST